MKEEKSICSLFPRPHHSRSESDAHAAAVIQQLAVEPEREVVTGASTVPTPEARSSFRTIHLPNFQVLILEGAVILWQFTASFICSIFAVIFWVVAR